MEFLHEVTGGAKGLPRGGIIQSAVYNKMIKYYMTTACPGCFEKMEHDIPKGAIAGLETLVASTTSDEWMTVLEAISDKKFFSEWNKAVQYSRDPNNRSGFDSQSTTAAPGLEWKLERIRSARVDTIYGIIGAQRGDSMKGKQFIELFGQHFVLSPEFANAIRIPDFRERASKSLPYLFADGAVIRARVIINVDQTVSLSEPTMQQQNLEHLVTLEMSLTPRIGKKGILASETILEMTEEPMTTGDWKIVDINFSLSDNYPLDPPQDDQVQDESNKNQ
jgi:hypothetical protein